VMPPAPVTGEDGAAGLGAAGAAGAAGLGVAGAGAGAAGFVAAGVTEAAGLVGAAGLRAGALRAAVFRAEGLRAALLAVLRAGFLATVLRAGFLALVLRAGLRALVLRALVFRAVAPRRALLAVVFLLLAVRFFPLVLVAMVSAPILPIAALYPSSGRVSPRITPPLVQACRPA
jgi:hypothetical protein